MILSPPPGVPAGRLAFYVGRECVLIRRRGPNAHGKADAVVCFAGVVYLAVPRAWLSNRPKGE